MLTMLNHNALTILGVLLGWRAEGLPPPSIRELMDITGMDSPNGIFFHLCRLRKLGLVTWDREAGQKARTLRATCRYERVPESDPVATGAL